MTRKVLVEFELDPSEYAAGEGPDRLEDTQDNARMLVQGMIRGEVDICATRLVGDLVLLFKGKVTPGAPPGSGARQTLALQHQALPAAIIATLQRLHHERPFQPIRGPISITAFEPTPTHAYYEVNVWRSATSDSVSTEPPVRQGE